MPSISLGWCLLGVGLHDRALLTGFQMVPPSGNIYVLCFAGNHNLATAFVEEPLVADTIDQFAVGLPILE